MDLGQKWAKASWVSRREEQHGQSPSGWRVASEEGLGGNGQQEPEGESLRGSGRSLGFLLGALGSQERVVSKGKEQTCNLTGPFWLPGRGTFGGLWALAAVQPGAGAVIHPQLRFNKHFDKDPEAHEGSVPGRCKEPCLSDASWEKRSWAQPHGGQFAYQITLDQPARSTSRSDMKERTDEPSHSLQRCL